jgi:hypothetical protein
MMRPTPKQIGDIYRPPYGVSEAPSFKLKPFLAMLGVDGVMPHPLNDPTIKLFVATRINKELFEQFAYYRVGADYFSSVWTECRRASSTHIYLVSDGDTNDIFCIAQPMENAAMLIIGKLTKHVGPLYSKCMKAFSAITLNANGDKNG